MVYPSERPKAAPYNMTSTELKSNLMDTLDDARAGFVSYITRNGRPAAAIVPVAVGHAYETKRRCPTTSAPRSRPRSTAPAPRSPPC